MSGPLVSFAQAWGCDDPREAMGRAIAHLTTTNGGSSPPHRLSSLVASLGAHIEYDSRRDTRLVLDDRPRIVVPRVSWKTWRRQRFGIAHELAHLIVWQGVSHGHRAELRRAELHGDLERLCNHGAALMLMPPEEFVFDLMATGFSSTGLQTLYDRYLVSWTTLLIRISEVLEGACVSTWALGVRPADPIDLPRVVGSWGDKRAYVPPGISERYLSRAVITTAESEGHAWTRELQLTFKRDPPTVGAIAARKPRPRGDQETLPLWGRVRVPDEHALIVGAQESPLPASAEVARRRGDAPEMFLLLLSGDGAEPIFSTLAEQRRSPARGGA